MRRYTSAAMAVMLAATATLSAVKTSAAGPFPLDTVTSKEAVAHDVVNVRHEGGAIFAGLALGLLGAAIVAHNSHYYGPHYYYPHYYSGYAYPPYPYYSYPAYPRYRYYRGW